MGKFMVVVVVTAVAPGCTIAKIHGSGGKPLLLNRFDTSAEYRTFEVSKMTAFDWTNATEIDDILRDSADVRIGDPDVRGVQNLRIEIGANLGTFFVNLFTLGLANARMVRVKGEVVPTTGSVGR